MITQERLKELLSYNPDTGVFTWKTSRARVKAGDVAGTCFTKPKGKSYAQIMLDGKLYLAHRLAWLFAYGHFPAHEIDHIDGDGTDNRLGNLRSVTRSENSKNVRLRSDNTSGHAGVHWDKGRTKWVAKIIVNSKTRHLGDFADLADAIEARKEAEVDHGFHPNHGQIRPL